MSLSSTLETPIEYLRGVGPDKSELLKKELKIFKFTDLLFHFPFRYIDRSKVCRIDKIDEEAAYVQIKGKLRNINVSGFGRKKRLTADLFDESGNVELVWFKGIQWIQKSLKAGQVYLVFGKPTVFRGTYNIVHPEMTLITGSNLENIKNIQAVYPSTEKLKKHGLDSKGISRLVGNLFEKISISDIEEFFPSALIDKYHFIDRYNAFKNIHIPEDNILLNKSIARLKFEELFLIQLEVLMLKFNRFEKSDGYIFERVGSIFNTFFKRDLEFELTNAQKRVLKEIRRDTLSGKQMNRLLQGDVGSGKTIVSLMTMLIAIDNGFQACMMAPTEILAQQHFKTLKDLCSKLGIRIQLLTGSVKGRDRTSILKGIRNDYIHILVGTHALLEEKVKFYNLGIAIIDEQHRFGVAQRARLWTKNLKPPHILVMTATPIPRTLAMTVYGDLDVSVINELPPGRKPIKTKHWYDKSRLKLNGFLKEKIAEGRQVYIVYPLIEESEAMDYKDLMDGYESFKRAFPLPDYQISIVHGRMKAEDKDYEMNRFVKGETQIMVSTTVIEVGVDVPNATIMVIESAERFGLSQLHQLRGRVGRGCDQSHCILMTGYKLGSESRKRIQIMLSTTDGFKIAEEDLKLRGPGDLHGTQQSGMLNLKLADLIKDNSWLKEARHCAMEIIKSDPHLNKNENSELKIFLQSKKSKSPAWSMIS